MIAEPQDTDFNSLVVRMIRYRIKDAIIIPIDETLTMVRHNLPSDPHANLKCRYISPTAMPDGFLPNMYSFESFVAQVCSNLTHSQ
jgi:hypothetical protein